MRAAVLFDFHGTIVQVEDPVQWVVQAAAACGHALAEADATVLAKQFVTAGRAGGPFPAEVPPHLRRLWPIRDLSREDNRACYVGLAATVDSGIDGLPEALYERLLTPADWIPYTDTLPVLRALRAAGVKVAVVSNIGFDIRPIMAGLGLADLVDAYALSYEIGACKPDPAIFGAACRLLGVAPGDTLMVGDTPADAGAAAVGCTCLVLPAQGPGAANGLRLVLDVAGVAGSEIRPAG